MRVHVGTVASSSAEPDGTVRFALEDGSVCVLDPASTAFDFWSRLLAKSRDYGWAVYAGCDPRSGRVLVLLHASLHTVESVAPDTQAADRIRVLLSASHAVHFLKTTRPGHAAMRRRLQEAAATGRQVVVTEDPRESEIIDVRFAPETAIHAVP